MSPPGRPIQKAFVTASTREIARHQGIPSIISETIPFLRCGLERFDAVAVGQTHHRPDFRF